MEAEEEASFRLMLDSLEIGESGWCTPLDTPQQWPHGLFLAGQGCLSTPLRVTHLMMPLMPPPRVPLVVTLKPPLMMALKPPLVMTSWGIFVA